MTRRLRQTNLPGVPSEGVALAPRLQDLEEAALLRARDGGVSDNTRDAYARTLARWHEWCVKYDRDPAFPIDPLTLVSFLEFSAARNYARATLHLWMCALSTLDARACGRPATLAREPLVRAWWRAYVREHPTPQEGAPLVSRDDLMRLIASLYRRRVTEARRLSRSQTRCVLVLGYMGAFRRGELATLRVGAVELAPRGLYVHWDRSKADQTGRGAGRWLLPQSETLLCPVHAWQEWLAHYAAAPRLDGPARAPGADEPAFPALSGECIRGPITGDGIYRRIVRLGRRAGIPITPHSLRAAFATDAAELHDEGEIAYHGRWKSRTTMERYVRRTKSWQKNPTAGLAVAKKVRSDDST